MEDAFIGLGILFLDTVYDEVPGNADDAVTLDHEEPRHHQVVAMSQVPQCRSAPMFVDVVFVIVIYYYLGYIDLRRREQQCTM